MEAVKKSVDRGVEVARAVRGALLLNGLEVGEFADKYGFPRATTSQAINGTRTATAEQIAALVKELGGTAEGWRELLWLAGKPEHVGKVRVG